MRNQTKHILLCIPLLMAADCAQAMDKWLVHIASGLPEKSENFQFLEYVVGLPNELKQHLVEFVDPKIIKKHRDGKPYAYKIQHVPSNREQTKPSTESFFYSEYKNNYFICANRDIIVLHPTKNLIFYSKQNEISGFQSIKLFKYWTEERCRTISRKLSNDSRWSLGSFIGSEIAECQDETIIYSFD